MLLHLLLRLLLVLRLLLRLLQRLLCHRLLLQHRGCNFIVDAGVPNPAKGSPLPTSLL